MLSSAPPGDGVTAANRPRSTAEHYRSHGPVDVRFLVTTPAWSMGVPP